VWRTAREPLATTHDGCVAGMESKDDAGMPTVVLRVKVPPPRSEDALRELQQQAAHVKLQVDRSSRVASDRAEVHFGSRRRSRGNHS
jgi:hypothetical protein